MTHFDIAKYSCQQIIIIASLIDNSNITITNSKSKFEFLFEFPVLTKALGALDYQTLKIIKNELQTNAACIDSDLGGGANGHLGMILTALEYALVATNTSYIGHIMPTIPIFANITPQHKVIRHRGNFKEDKMLFKEMISLEKALL